MNYSTFNFFLARTPLYPFVSLKEEFVDSKIQDLLLQEAIYIASPTLYAELQKYLSGTIKNEDEKQRIGAAVFRYISRMSTRCTPFGLFAGCSVGLVSECENTDIVLRNYNRTTRLDMYFLCTLSQELSKLPEVKEKVRYYPNTTLYPIGKKYRYIEYRYKGNRRTHQISSVEQSSYLNTIVKMARVGVRVNDILTYLLEKDIDENDAKAFVEDLIDSQVLVSELSPSVTGDDYFAQLISVLENIDVSENIVSSLKDIQMVINQLDNNKNGDIRQYQSIIQKIESLRIPFEEKFLFQVDMVRNTSKVVLGKEITDELQKAMLFLNKTTTEQKNETLQQFQEAFYKRYEDREVPLMEVLDTEIGIGYPISQNSGDVSPLLENFFVFQQAGRQAGYKSNPFLSILLRKTVEALQQNKSEVVLNDSDIKNSKVMWDDLPATMYSMFEVLNATSENPLIHLTGFSGACAANLLARFAHTDEKVTNFVREIVSKEQELSPNVLFAEIAHLPDSRVGNILSRPHIRDYEILFLANSNLPEKQSIYLSDLLLSVRQGRICLRSKRLNKEIIPRLTNAHNYRGNPMPIYHFLCDMQVQQGRSGLYFNWGYLKNEFDFLPRVRYGNVILALATWKVKVVDFKHLHNISSDNELLSETKRWREKYPLPPNMLLSDGDNELLIDWTCARSIRTLFSIIKKRETITLTEFLYNPENSIVKDESGKAYLNECIVAFYKNQKQ